jgi:cyclase
MACGAIMTDFHWKNDPQWQRAFAESTSPSQVLQGDVKVYTYQSAFDPYFTSSYYFETERGVVLVDTQIFNSAVADLWEHIQRNTSGDVRYVVNTHAHPDHYFGNTYIRKVAPQAMFISSIGVRDDMLATAPARVAKTRSEWGGEVTDDPSTLVLPEVCFDGSLTLAFDEITLKLWEAGPAEAPVQLVGWIPEHRAVITADIVQNRQHLYFSDRTLVPWLGILADIEKLDPAHVLTGHQGIAGPSILAETKAWIATYLGLMAKELPTGVDVEDIDSLDERGREAVREGLMTELPDWFDPYFFQGKTVVQLCLEGHRSELVGAALLEAQGRAG